MSGINEKKTIIELDEETDLKGVYLYGMKAEGPKSVKVDASKLKVSGGGEGGGDFSGNLADLSDVDTAEAVEGDILKKVGEKWKSAKAEWLKTGELNGVKINTIEDLITYFQQYGIGYPATNTPPILYLDKNYYVFRPEDTYTIPVTYYDKEGGELKLIGKKPAGTYTGSNDSFEVTGLGSGSAQLNLKEAIFGKGSTETFGIGTYRIEDIFLADAFGRRSEAAQSITFVVGSVNVTSSFDDSRQFGTGSTISLDYRITSVAREVAVSVTVGGQIMRKAGTELTYSTYAAETSEFDVVLAGEEAFNPTQSYPQTFTTPAFAEPGEYVVQIQAWAKDDPSLKSPLLTKRIVVLQDGIVYTTSTLDTNADYRINNTVILPVNIYHSQDGCTYKVRAWVQNIESISTETAESAVKMLEIPFALPDEPNTYTICLRTTVITPTGLVYATNTKELALNVRSVSDYSVLTASEYNLELYLSANGLSNSLPDWEIWKNKYYLNQDYFGELHGFLKEINGWVDHQDGTDQRPPEGDCLHANGEAYCLVNYSPFAGFSSKANRKGEGMTIELMLHNSDLYKDESYTFSIGNPSATQKKGIAINTQRLEVYYSPSDVLSVPVRTGKNYMTKLGDFIANSDEYVHITITYDLSAKLVLVFCNGVISAATTFPDAGYLDTDAPIVINGHQAEDGTISGFSDCNVKFLRVYQKCLGFDEVLNNYIASIYYDQDRIHAETINNPNKPMLTTFSVFGNIYGATKDDAVFAECTMTPGQEETLFDKYIFSPLAKNVEDQRYADLSQRHPLTVSWQGNSSLAYPIKNWEFEFYDPEQLAATGKYETKAFNMVRHADGTRPWYFTKVYQCKANYIDSSSCNNQGIAKLADYVYRLPWPWPAADYPAYCNGSTNPFPYYNVDGDHYSKYPIKPARLAIDAVPVWFNRQHLDASGNLRANEFGGLLTWGLKQQEELYSMPDYKADKWHKNTVWRSESNGDSVHPQLRAGSYGLFDLSSMPLKVDLLDRPLTQAYIDQMGLVEGKDYYDLDKPERIVMRAEQMRWRVGAETVMDFECRNPKSLGRGHWETSTNGYTWSRTTNLIDPHDLDLNSKAKDRQKRWVWDEWDNENNCPLRTKGTSSVNYFEDMLTAETVPFLGSETGGIGKIDKTLGELAAQQHADFISAMKWVDTAPDECFANPEIFGKYFHLQSCIDYVIMCIVLYLSDQLGRNLTFVQWDTREIDMANRALKGNPPVFYPTMYDMDTALGTNVQGTLTEDAFLGWQYPIGNINDNAKYYQPEESASQNYNCGENRFWRRISALYGDTIIRRYRDLRSGVTGQDGKAYDGVLTHNFIISTFCKEIISRIGERFYNMDAEYKYIGMDYESQDAIDAKRKYLINARGNKLMFINQFLLDRLSYVDSLFRYEPQGSAVSEMIYFQHRYNGTFEITMKTEVPAFIRVSFAQNQSSYVYCDGKLPAKVSYTYQSVGGDASEKILRIYNAAPIVMIEGFSGKDLTKAKLSTASSLRAIDLSNNPALNELELSGCRNLEELNLSGCNLSTGFGVDISNCVFLRKFLAHNSTVRTGDFTHNPYLADIDVRECPNVSILNLEGLKRVQSIQFTPENIEQLNISNCSANVDVQGCVNLTSLIVVDNSQITAIAPEKGFARLRTVDIRNCPKLVNISNLLKDNKIITELPDNFLDGCKGTIKYMDGTFQNTDIETYPVGFFTNTFIELVSANSTFSRSAIKGNISSHFIGSTQLSAVSNCYDGCSGVTGKSPNVNGYRWWESRTGYAMMMGNNCFRGCPNLDDYKDVPIAWGGAPTTTFMFSSSQSKSITNSSLVCSVPYKKIADNKYEVYGAEGETVDFTFKCDNHVDYTNSYEVVGTRTQNYSVLYIPLIKLRINVYSTSTYVSGATVAVDGIFYTSDQNGYVNIRTNKAIEGTVVAPGYQMQNFSVARKTTDYSQNIYLYQTVAVTFIVKDDYGDFVQNSEVTCNEVTKTTNQYGECIFDLAKGTFDYTVTNKRYETATGNIVVSTSAKTLSVTTNINWATYAPEPNGNIQMMVGCNSSSYSMVTLSITSNDANYSIYWADGTIDNAIGDGTQTYSRIFILVGSGNWKNIEVRNCEGITACNVTNKNNILAYWSVGDSLVSGLTFAIYPYLKTVGVDIFKNDGERTSCSEGLSCLYSSGSLVYLPDRLTDPLINVTDWSSFLKYQGSLTSYLPELWKKFTGENIVKSNCFRGCTKAPNWNEVPYDWGGPRYICNLTLAIFKDNTWYLNQEVKANNQLLTQNADGTYKGEVYRINSGDVDITVNGEVVKTITLNSSNYKKDIGLYISMGDNPDVYLGNKVLDFSTGDIYEDYIVNKENEWAYDTEMGGYKTEYIQNKDSKGNRSITFYFEKINPLKIKGVNNLTLIYSVDSILDGINYKLSSAGDSQKFGSYGDYDHRKDTFCIEDTIIMYIYWTNYQGNRYWCIHSLSFDEYAIPPLPSDFVPTVLTLESKLSLEQRIARIEQTLKLNDHADIQ